MNDFVIEMNDVIISESSKQDYDDIIVNGEIFDTIYYTLTDLINKTAKQYNKPKISNDGYIIPIENNIIRNIPFPIIYTETEVKMLFNEWFNDSKFVTFDEWFETVKKK